jgi:membrane-bound metal-dependent hydrolase YbcI (DUF457 family)
MRPEGDAEVLGRDHALSAAAAFAAAAPFLHDVTGVRLAAAAVLAAGAGTLPDIDHPDSTVSRTFGFLTRAFAWCVAKISGGHRHGTHSLAGVVVFAAAALAAAGLEEAGPAGAAAWRAVPAGLVLALLYSAGLRALRAGGHHADVAGIGLAAVTVWQRWDSVLVTAWNIPVLACCVAVGAVAHLAGDMCTHGGCPLLWPFSRREFHLLPASLRVTTGRFAEHWIISPLLLAVLGWLAWRDASLGWPAVHPDPACPGALACAPLPR